MSSLSGRAHALARRLPGRQVTLACPAARDCRASRGKLALGILAAGLLLAGCTGRSTAAVSPTPTARQTEPVLSESFYDEELDVHFPASWGSELLGLGTDVGAIRLYAARDRRASVLIMLTEPGQYHSRDANGHDLARMCAVAGRHEAILQAGFMTISGVRLAMVEHEHDGQHCLTLASARSSAKRTVAEIKVTAVCRTKDWPAQRATMMAILGSMHFYLPGGA